MYLVFPEFHSLGAPWVLLMFVSCPHPGLLLWAAELSKTMHSCISVALVIRSCHSFLSFARSLSHSLSSWYWVICSKLNNYLSSWRFRTERRIHSASLVILSDYNTYTTTSYLLQTHTTELLTQHLLVIEVILETLTVIRRLTIYLKTSFNRLKYIR